jgi:hypothetical protein
MKFCLYIIHLLFNLDNMWTRISTKIDYGIVRFVKMDSVKVKTLKCVNEFLFILHVLTAHFRQNLVWEINDSGGEHLWILWKLTLAFLCFACGCEWNYIYLCIVIQHFEGEFLMLYHGVNHCHPCFTLSQTVSRTKVLNNSFLLLA